MRAIAPGLAVVALFLLFRLPFLTADPPDSLVTNYHDCASAVFDEGWWSANARGLALFGNLFGGGFDLLWVSPVFSAVMSGAFAVGGVSLGTARLATLLVSVLGLGLVLRMDRGERGLRTGWLAGLFLAVSFVPAQLGRMALPESVGTVLGLAGVWLLLRGGASRQLLAGACAALAVLTKPHFLFLLPTLLAGAAVLAARHRTPILPGIARIAAGATVPLVVWGIVLIAHRAEATQLFAFYDIGRWVARNPAELGVIVAGIKPAIQSLVVGVIYRHPLFVNAPGLFVLAALGAPVVWAAALRSRDRSGVPDAVVLFGLWMLFAALFLGSLPFQPLRYFLPALPALAWLAAWVVREAANDATPGASGKVAELLRWGAGTLVGAQLIFAGLRTWAGPGLVSLATGGDLDPLHPEPFGITAFLLEVLRSRSMDAFIPLYTQQASWASLALLGVVSLAGGAVAGLAMARWGRRAFDPAAWRTLRFLPAALLLYQGFLWGSWIPRQAHTVPDLGRDLQGRLPAGSVVSPGGTYSLESRLRFDSSAVRDGRMFDATGTASHFLCLESHPALGRIEPGGVEREFPGAARLRGYELTGGYVYGLYRAGQLPKPVAGS